jgi:hypothetical protein
MKSYIKKTLNISNLIPIIIVSCVVAFSSCKKGEIGPAGPQGTQGQTGPVGQKATSTDVTANFTPTSSSVSFSITTNTNDIVLVYFKDPANSNSIVQTPFTWYNNTPSPVAYFWFQVNPTTVTVYAQKPTSGQSVPAFTSATNLDFRIIVISAYNRTVNPTLPTDLDYDSVKKQYNLKD